MKTALVIVDPLRDFVAGGSLAVPGGDGAVARIAAALPAQVAAGNLVVLVREHHVAPGAHFASSLGQEPDYIDTWPDHCVVGTDGARVAAPLEDALAALGLPHVTIYKGQRSAAYSGFEGEADDGRTLTEVLSDAEVGEILVCGIATDYCVGATARDGLEAGLAVTVVRDLCAALSEEDAERTLAGLAAAGAQIA